MVLLDVSMASVAKWLRHRIVIPTFVGSIPIIRPSKFHPLRWLNQNVSFASQSWRFCDGPTLADR